MSDIRMGGVHNAIRVKGLGISGGPQLKVYKIVTRPRQACCWHPLISNSHHCLQHRRPSPFTFHCTMSNGGAEVGFGLSPPLNMGDIAPFRVYTTHKECLGFPPTFEGEGVSFQPAYQRATTV